MRQTKVLSRRSCFLSTNKKIKVRFLGTNGWYDTDQGNTLCILIQTGKEHIILDAGNGIYKADRFIRDNKPVYLFISHFHLDHIIGLHILLKFKFKNGLRVIGPKGIRRHLGRFIGRPYTADISRLPFKMTLEEAGEKKLPFKYEYKKLRHPVTCYGYSFYFGKKKITFCTDTGRCANLEELSKGADLLLLECSFGPGEDSSFWPHLNPEEAALTAKKAGAKRLFLSHFDAEKYTKRSHREKAGKVARRIFPSTFVAYDLTTTEV